MTHGAADAGFFSAAYDRIIKVNFRNRYFGYNFVLGNFADLSGMGFGFTGVTLSSTNGIE
jgi:hypothetical protein